MEHPSDCGATQEIGAEAEELVGKEIARVVVPPEATLPMVRTFLPGRDTVAVELNTSSVLVTTSVAVVTVRVLVPSAALGSIAISADNCVLEADEIPEACTPAPLMVTTDEFVKCVPEPVIVMGKIALWAPPYGATFVMLAGGVTCHVPIGVSEVQPSPVFPSHTDIVTRCAPIIVDENDTFSDITI